VSTAVAEAVSPAVVVAAFPAACSAVAVTGAEVRGGGTAEATAPGTASVIVRRPPSSRAGVRVGVLGKRELVIVDPSRSERRHRSGVNRII